MSAIRYLVEQAVNLLNFQKLCISRFHAAATEKTLSAEGLSENWSENRGHLPENSGTRSRYYRFCHFDAKLAAKAAI